MESQYNTCNTEVGALNVKADKISEAEAEIMRVVWEHNGPVTYSQIRTVLTEQKGWESPTVNTLVNRLVKKGILTQDKKEVYYYTAVISEEEYTQAKTQSFIQKVYGGNVKGLMSALLTYGDVTQEDLEELRAQWKNAGAQHE
jgi:BlaI family penicillinase repressor